MSLPRLITTEAEALAVTGTAAEFALAMVRGRTYAYVCTVDSWVAQGASPQTATAGSGSAFVPAGLTVYLDGGRGAALSAIRNVGSGTASLYPVGLDKIG